MVTVLERGRLSKGEEKWTTGAEVIGQRRVWRETQKRRKQGYSVGQNKKNMLRSGLSLKEKGRTDFSRKGR